MHIGRCIRRVCEALGHMPWESTRPPRRTYTCVRMCMCMRRVRLWRIRDRCVLLEEEPRHVHAAREVAARLRMRVRLRA